MPLSCRAPGEPTSLGETFPAAKVAFCSRHGRASDPFGVGSRPGLGLEERVGRADAVHRGSAMKQCLLGLIALLSLTGGVSAQTPPRPGFDAFQLGMSLAELKTALKSNSFFVYSGEPDVTVLARPNTNLIDVPGISYFARGVFQVVDGKLYSITLELNPDQLDYFGMYTALAKKYGEPTALDPSSARWESPTVRLSLEKPLTVKYLDMAVFQKLQKEGRAQEALQQITRDQFLQNF